MDAAMVGESGSDGKESEEMNPETEGVAVAANTGDHR